MVIITHYREKCIGCNACVEIAPERWQMSRKDGKAILIKGKVKKDTSTVKLDDLEYEQNRKAAVNCPVNIIKVTKL